MRKTNDEKLTNEKLKTYSEKKYFSVNNKWGECWDNIYVYIHLCSLCFGVTLLTFHNSKKKTLQK